MSGALRSLKRNVAKERMKMMGFTHVNKRLAANWRDLGAPDYVKRLKSKAKFKEEVKE